MHMTILFASTEHTLRSGEVLSGRPERDYAIGVEYGQVWLTAEGCQEDYWLAAGDTVMLAPGRLVVVEAGTDSRLWLQSLTQPGAMSHQCLPGAKGPERIPFERGG
jgi:hypothetical protein